MSATPGVEAALPRSNSPKAEGFLKGGPRKLLIGGKWVAAKSGKTFESINPATEEVIATVAEAGQADVDDAVKAARRAFEEGPWPRMQPFERARLLTKFAELLEANAQELGELDTLDGGRVFRLTSTVDPFGSAEGYPLRGRLGDQILRRDQSQRPRDFQLYLARAPGRNWHYHPLERAAGARG